MSTTPLASFRPRPEAARRVQQFACEGDLSALRGTVQRGGAVPVRHIDALRRVFRLVYLDLPACYDSRPLLRQQIVMQSII